MTDTNEALPSFYDQEPGASAAFGRMIDYVEMRRDQIPDIHPLNVDYAAGYLMELCREQYRLQRERDEARARVAEPDAANLAIEEALASIYVAQFDPATPYGCYRCGVLARVSERLERG